MCSASLRASPNLALRARLHIFAKRYKILQGENSMSLQFSINSLYICVKDMNRAVDFYEKLFGQKVSEKDPVYSVFVINGFRYGLFANHEVKESKQWGNNCLPSFSVNDIELFKRRLEQLKRPIVFPMTIIGKNKVLEFTDTEGNDVEITCPHNQ
jgi:predicted enzyme related to lactoylglutathione lyase